MNEDVPELIQRAQRGDKEAFGQIYKIYLKKIYRYIYYMIQNRQLAEDITQNAFIKAWKALPSFAFTKNGTFQAYLFKIARNLLTDYQRKKKDISLELIADVVKSDEDLIDYVTRKEEEKTVGNALATLDDDERQIVVLRYFEELSFSEISKIVGKNEGAIRVQVHRILIKLKNRIKDYGN